MRSPVTLSPFDLEVLELLQRDERRWLTTDQIRAALPGLDDTPRDRTRVLASLSWMARGRYALVSRWRRDLDQPTLYALTTTGDHELAERAQTRLAAA